jgi:lipoprotein-anchoring transpeptidase ErfK/SrfK
MFKKNISISLLTCLSLLILHCKKDEAISSKQNKDSTIIIKTDSDSVKIAPEIKINYTAFVFPKGKKDSAMSAFDEKYTEEEQYTILALNRLDTKNRWRADTLVIPDTLNVDFLVYSPFPNHLEVLKKVDKIAFFSYAIQAFAIYENGNLIKWGPTSMGKKSTPTKKGLTFANWKKELSISSVNSSWKLRWNFNVYNHLGIGWHQYDLPGFHASHSCLRLLEEDAKYLYTWAEIWKLDETRSKVLGKGTPVYIFGDSDFKTKPWRKLLKDANANDISEADLSKEIEPYVSNILEEQKNSKYLQNLAFKKTPKV